jgi:hypothetical protein
MSKLTVNAKNTKTHRNEVGFVVFGAFQCENTPSKHPIFSPFCKKCKDGFRNKLNISSLHFCILQFTFFTNQKG